MQNTSFQDSADFLLAKELIDKRYIPGLQSLLLVMLIGAPLVLGLSILQGKGGNQIFLAATASLLTGLAYWLLRRGLYRWAGRLLVVNLIGCSSASMLMYGSIRSGAMLGFIGAVVAAGMTLGKKALMLTVALSAAVLAALTWAEMSGLFVTPDFAVGLRSWVLSLLFLTAIAVSVHTSRRVVLRALHEQHRELKRREQAEQALHLSEDRFSRIFRSSPAAIIVQVMDGMTTLDVNPAFERLFGYPRDEFLGRSDAALWDEPEARAAFIRKMETAGRVINLPVDARTQDGRLLNLLLSSEIEGLGQARIIVSTITDISAETRARQAARQSAELFAKAFDFSPISMSITRVSDGVFLAVNSAANTIQGFSAEELLGRPSIATGAWSGQQERDSFIAMLRSQQSVQSYETSRRHKDGHRVDCRMWATLVEIAGEECVLSAVINITEQKRHEALLIDLARGLSAETGEAFFGSAMQHLSQAIGADLVLVGETADGQRVNSLAIVQDGLLQPNIGYDLAGTLCELALRQDELCVYGHGVQALFPQDPLLRDGRYQAYAGMALRDADGSAIGIVNAAWRKPLPLSPDRDALVQIFANRITSELVRLRRDREISRLNETLEQRVNERTEQLKATNAELESFGYSVSHDLQSPLRSIEGFSVLLARRLKDRLNEEEERLFDRVRVNVVRMHELISDLLALARASKGKLVLDQVDLSAAAQQVVAQLRQRDPQRQVQVTIAPGVNARCDGKFARIILENLLGNAWKYSRDRADAQIEFGALPAREDGRKMLFVRDNGAGFNMAYADSLFKPFHRLHHDNEFEGSGVGLATVHRILERHGGVIRGESSEGEGACFYFSFDPRFGLSVV